ncbi:MAG: hypothetical protein J6Z50_08605, partial [Fibrobacterales bacterium]|nr:hypothetical protein [Fibrobacterales bacterium]
RVLSKVELESRFEIYGEQYVKTIDVEAKLCVQMYKGSIYPAAVRWAGELSGELARAELAGAKMDKSPVKKLAKLVSESQKIVAKIEEALAKPAEKDLRKALASRRALLLSMNRLRDAVDRMEREIPDDVWPLPSYQEMLFVK